MYEPASNVELVAEVTALPETSDFARQPVISADETKYAVKVRGLLRSGVPDSSKGMTPNMGHSIKIHRNCQGMPPKVHPECPFHPDYDLPDNIELYSVLVAYASGTQQRTMFPQSWTTQVGLVLTPVAGHQGRYRRVGYLHHDMRREIAGILQELPSVFEDSKLMEVEIV